MNKITDYWKDKQKGKVDFNSDLAALKHAAQGHILELRGKVSSLKRDRKQFLRDCRGANTAFKSLLAYKREIENAKEEYNSATEHYKELFGPLPVEPTEDTDLAPETAAAPTSETTEG